MTNRLNRLVEQEYLIRLNSGEVIPFKPWWEKTIHFSKDDVKKISKFHLRDTPFVISNKCQLDCFFCRDGFRKDKHKKVVDVDIEDLKLMVQYNKDTISFEWGEPTLDRKKIIEYITYAKDNWVRERILVTNAVLLFDINYCKELVEAGVTLYNINVWAHNKEIFKKIYQAKEELFDLRCQWIRNLITLWQWKRVRFNFVVNTVNYKFLLDYVVWVYKKFPEIFYIEFNFVKVLWKTIEWKSNTMPSYPDIFPYMMKALKFCELVGLRVIIEGIPLCYLPWYEHLNIDIDKYNIWDYTFFSEKQKLSECQKCSLYKICTWFRISYFKFYPENHVKPMSNITVNEVLLKHKLYKQKQFLYDKYSSDIDS